MGSRFDGTFSCTAELFAGSKSIEKLRVTAQSNLKPIDPGDYKLVMKVVAQATLKIMPKATAFEENFEVTWKVVVASDGRLSFEDRKTGKLKYDYAVGIGGMTLDQYEAGNNKAKVGVEIEIEGETQRSDFEVTLKGNPAASSIKVLKYLVVLPVGSFPTNVAEVKKIKMKPAGYADWAGLKKFYDDLPSLTRQKIENGEKPGDRPVEIVGLADDTGNAADNSKLGERRAIDVRDWFKTFSGNRTDSIYLTKGKGSGIASKGKDDPKKRMVMITLLCEKEV